MAIDRRLRTLYRLAEQTSGEQLEQVRSAIRRRRRELENETDGFAIWDGFDPERRHDRWVPGEGRFVPAPRDAVPARVRRPGESGYRIVGIDHRAS